MAIIEQRERLYQLDKPSLAQDTAGPTPPQAASPGWIGLQRCNISPVASQVLEMPHVLLHPEIGVALIDIAPGQTPHAESAFRARLEAARFAAIFPGHLPVVQLQFQPEDLIRADALLREAFAALPPISLPGGDGWVSVVRRALAQRAPSRQARAAAVESAPPALSREVAAH
ncbi:hypothetical protein, partial [Paracraurococcus ruber]